MAIIKCPQCGNDVSDHAIKCPSCGLPIAGNASIVHHSEPALPSEPSSSTPPITPVPKNNHHGLLIFGLIFVFLLIVTAGGVYYFTHQNDDKETEAYESAMQSSDMDELQSYLDNYSNAPQAHRDSIEAHLAILQQALQEWNNVLRANSKSALLDYINRHPDSPFREDAIHKIDSIDYQKAQSLNTIEAYEAYINEHADGDYVDQAKDLLQGLSDQTLKPEEEIMLKSVCETFLRCISEQDLDALPTIVSPILSSFLSKQNATRSDVATFIRRDHESGTVNVTWTSLKNYTFIKQNSDDGAYEYTVEFAATEDKEWDDNSVLQKQYNITAKINSNGQITELNMKRLVDE